MRLDLTRLEIDKDATIGELRIDGQWFCWTLEDLVRAAKIKHQTAIPAGRYKVIINHSNRFKQQMPLVVGVNGFEGIRIHPGNDAEDTSGCILVGAGREGNKITDSRTAYNRLMKRLENADKIEINIEQPAAWPKWGQTVVMKLNPDSGALEVPSEVGETAVGAVITHTPGPGILSNLPIVSSIQVTKNGGKAWQTMAGSGLLSLLGGAVAFIQQNKVAMIVLGAVAIVAILCWFIRVTKLDLERMRIGADPNKLNVH